MRIAERLQENWQKSVRPQETQSTGVLLLLVTWCCLCDVRVCKCLVVIVYWLSMCVVVAAALFPKVVCTCTFLVVCCSMSESKPWPSICSVKYFSECYHFCIVLYVFFLVVFSTASLLSLLVLISLQ